MKSLFAILILCVSCVAQPLPKSAKLELAGYTAYHLGAVIADDVTSLQGFHQGCVETDTFLYGSHPSLGRMAATNAVEVGGGLAFGWFIMKHAAGKNRHLAGIVPVLFGTIHLGQGVIHNMNTKCR